MRVFRFLSSKEFCRRVLDIGITLQLVSHLLVTEPLVILNTEVVGSLLVYWAIPMNNCRRYFHLLGMRKNKKPKEIPLYMYLVAVLTWIVMFFVCSYVWTQVLL